MDETLNQEIPYYVASQGFEVIPMDCLEWNPSLLDGDFTNLFWEYGQRILSALFQIADTQGLYAVYLSNYGCGPDSFLLTYAEMIMGTKPFLALEVDEHGSSGGYQTRIEAFLDVIRFHVQSAHKTIPHFIYPREKSTHEEIKRRKLWIPPMHSVGAHLFAATFRSRGYDAQLLDLEDETTFTMGKKWTRGSECLPAPLTLGRFLDQMNKERAAGSSPENDHALFLPTSTGPCRFGQYRTLDRIIPDLLPRRP
jgi:predicted nucleotide-binding protein (sugar kinase/HSP70/actin superfamily)